MDPNERKRSFKGEQALWTALKSLREGKATTTLYVTQDSGELNLDEQGGERYDQGLGRLKEKLEKEGFKLQAASLTPDPKTGAAAKIPTDGVLLLAGPQGPMPEPKAQALRQFLKDGGKAIILADVNKDPRLEPVVPAGQQALEAVLAEYGVRLGRDVALTLINPEDPTAITAMFASRGADTGFAGGLVVERMEFLGVRSVRPAEGQTAFQVNPLYVTPKMVQQGVGAMTVTFTEEALRASPRQLIADLRAGKDEQRLNQIVNGPIFPVAVTVREQATPNPMDPHAALRQGGTGNPKLVVFGDATFVSNKAIANPQTGDLSYRILATTLAWLRGKSTAVEGAPPPKVRDTYKLNVSSQEELDTLRYLPGLVALLGVAFVGAGVWFMRRR
jgi:L-amino acid N-acyltransferase YncA